MAVQVRGRTGVGRDSVGAALASAGIVVRDDGELRVYVLAEVVKPEDRRNIEAAAQPTLVVLNKADLPGVGAGEPMRIARQRCVRYRALTGAPVVPMAAHLAGVQLDDEAVRALRLLAAQPVDLSSADALLAADHPVPADTRVRLLTTLDLSGIALAVRAIGADRRVDTDQLRRACREYSGLHGALTVLAAMSARVRYQRIRAASSALRALAVGADPALGARIDEFLNDDDTVLARMAAATAAVGTEPGPAATADPAAQLRRAVYWQRYSRRCDDPVGRACGSDIARGSLRLWQRGRAAGRAR